MLIETRYGWRTPTQEQEHAFADLRIATIAYGRRLADLCPAGDDLNAALDHLQDCLNRALNAVTHQ